MNKLIEEYETLITGGTVVTGGRVDNDENSQRILFLIDSVLQRIGSDSSGWDTLYRDPADGRFWELVYPQSFMHGGGPPTLRLLSEADACIKYQIETEGSA